MSRLLLGAHEFQTIVVGHPVAVTRCCGGKQSERSDRHDSGLWHVVSRCRQPPVLGQSQVRVPTCHDGCGSGLCSTIEPFG